MPSIWAPGREGRSRNHRRGGKGTKLRGGNHNEKDEVIESLNHACTSMLHCGWDQSCVFQGVIQGGLTIDIR